ncbi:MAG: Gfo/Idh/MocA family protein [Halobacteriaceae archaeon]
MTGDALRCGVIGVAGAGERHGEGFVGADGADLVAGADVVPDHAATFADQFDCAAYTDHVEMVENAALDAVSIATPSGTHADIAVDCMEHGAHVICEKPLDVYLDRVDRMIEIADREDRTLAGIFQRRADPANQRARDAIQSGALGDPVLGDAHVKWHRTQAYYDSGDWRGTRELDGGCMFNQGIHEIDLLQWLMGGVESVCAMTDTTAHEMECEDVAVVALAFENGAYGTIEATTSTPAGTSRLEVDGTDGVYVPDERFVTADGERDLDAMPDPPDGPRSGQFQDFVDAVRAGRDPMVTGRAARDAVEVILAAYASASLDRRVRLDELRDLTEHT